MQSSGYNISRDLLFNHFLNYLVIKGYPGPKIKILSDIPQC